jgi:copper oxidase (laccase) domain-containing protein
VVKKDERIEHFSALDAVGVCRSGLIKRIPGIDVAHDKAGALRRLDSAHREIRASLGMDGWPMVTAEQIHASTIAVIDQVPTRDQELPGCDGLITNQRGIVLGIHVADCCAVFIVDPVRSTIALLHSGRKGTELEIVVKGIDQMRENFSSDPSDLVIQLSPCVRPPHYETDFAAKIIDQCRSRGVQHIRDSGICTACDLDQYYSYRAEKGKTGRMLALLALM